MNVKITTKQFELKRAEVEDDGIKLIYDIIDTSFKGQLNIVFDEDLYIDWKSNFLDDFKNIIELWKHKVIIMDNMLSLQNAIQHLLYDVESKGYLFKVPYPNMKYIHLHKDLMFNKYLD